MKANELMIGDWIYFHHNDEWDTKVPGRVSVISKNNTEFLEDSFETKVRTEGYIQVEAHDGIQFWYMREGAHFEPIPLTPEILEKNGFEHIKQKVIIPSKSQEEVELEYMYCKGLPCSFDIIHDYLMFNSNIDLCNIRIIVNYVHELQHLLKLCGIDKEIIV